MVYANLAGGLAASLVLGATAFAGPKSPPAPPTRPASWGISARDVSGSWLSRVDAGHYAESWAAAGALFQANMASRDWVARIGAVRPPLGPVLSRRLIEEEVVHALPGAPDGDYELITYRTDFARKAAALETVVLGREPGGWRVDGYFVR
ncbi:MAG: DUF4019 domain-containing protein [Alphaproteobacteria bacterium]|nr:DUF4019 domain-containing protein [Alphaproteobacteria bacterium]